MLYHFTRIICLAINLVCETHYYTRRENTELLYSCSNIQIINYSKATLKSSLLNWETKAKKDCFFVINYSKPRRIVFVLKIYWVKIILCDKNIKYIFFENQIKKKLNAITI